jgi:hypothetical protein
MAVTFDRFDLASYRLFLRCKALPESEVEFHPATESYTLSAPARFAPLLGVTRPAVRESFPLANFLFADQKELTAQALDCKRFALWCLCGYGKTLCGWEFGRQASLRTGGGRALIVTTNDLVPQWIEEADTVLRRHAPRRATAQPRAAPRVVQARHRERRSRRPRSLQSPTTKSSTRTRATSPPRSSPS